MAMAIHSLGSKAISLTGAQIGIVTDSTCDLPPGEYAESSEE